MLVKRKKRKKERKIKIVNTMTNLSSHTIVFKKKKKELTII